jgi:hypothetical protein
VLADRERELGSDHPDTLSARLSLGALFEGRDPQRSREMRVEAAAGWGRIAAERSRRLGPVHPETVDAREFHASLHGTFVDEADRLPLMEELTTDHERILGPDHPRTLHALVELANQYGYTDPRRLALATQLRTTTTISLVTTYVRLVVRSGSFAAFPGARHGNQRRKTINEPYGIY